MTAARTPHGSASRAVTSTATSATTPTTASDAGRRTALPRLPSTLRLGWERTRVETLAFFRERDAIVFIFAYPIIMLAIFATVFGQDGGSMGDPADGTPVPFAQYFLPGMIATGIMLTTFQTLAINIAVERDEGTLKRLRATPLPATSYFLGKVGQILLVTAVQLVLLLAVASLAYDVPMPSGAGDWLTFAWIVVLSATTGAVCGIGFSSLPRTGRSANAVVTPVVLVLQFISGVFFVFTDLPTWMQRVAEVFPLKWMAQGLRSVFLPDHAEAWEASGSWQTGATAVILGAWLIIGLVVGVRTFRWRRRDDG